MALVEYAGAVSLEVDSREYEVTTLNVQTNTGRKLVKTMNKAMRAKGFSRGIVTYELSISAVVPINATALDWASIEGAKLTVQPVGGGQRYSYIDCFSLEAGEKYQVDGEAMIDVKLAALRKVLE